jgi:adenine-specific DNA-methyltransferase
MPTLHWIGKEKVVNHHQDVPYRVLEHQYGFTVADGDQKGKETGSGNKIIHGDNLEALKSLLPEYEGRIKCIYIDPPYNTGNEGWVYNDNVNDPKIKKWLHQVVGKDGEDLSRHDKWLCMMYPRLKLLQKLLSNDGSIFISIDDNEQANLKLICDEIFGAGNFINNIIWQKKYSPQNDARYFSDMHDFIICYAKNKGSWNRNLLIRSERQDARYKNLDKDSRGNWKSSDLSVKTYSAATDYPITTPSGRVVNPPAGYSWRVSKQKFEELVADNRIWFGRDGNNVPSIKRFLLDVQQGTVPVTIWFRDEVGDNQSSKQELKKIFDEAQFPFETPKPPTLIERILQISTDEYSIILDSFAGSGTTGHAVLNKNKEDSGNRKFIIIEMEDYAETITAERVKRVAKGYGDIEGTGGAFDYYTLGEPMFNEDTNLNENVGEEKIRQYVYYTETKQPLENGKPYQKKDNAYFLDKYNATGYYFFYEKDSMTTLNNEFLATMKTKADQYVIYADNCLLSKEFMLKKNIVFKKIPRDITRF